MANNSKDLDLPTISPERIKELAAIDQVLQDARDLFLRRNDTYTGAKKDESIFSAFFTNLPVRTQMLSPIAYALTLCSKQDTATWTLLAKLKKQPSYFSIGTEAQLREKLLDSIVYRIIVLALLQTDPTEGLLLTE